ncbi:MAG: hypothetical protein QOH12_3370 [Solirubrobacteraceae bacterium]|jgi:Arc/MetJ-type ribon-helix-helix transcriptional regulator|nr:hypothetical protein [Solirubrobacteraceae bacterium]
MSVQIAVRLEEDDLRRLDAAVARGVFPSRAAAMRAGLTVVLREEREVRIGEAYRRAYAAAPDDVSVGLVGLRLGVALMADPGDRGSASDPPSM